MRRVTIDDVLCLKYVTYHRIRLARCLQFQEPLIFGVHTFLMSFDMLADHRKFGVLTSREPDQFSLASFGLPKHFLQIKCSVDHGPNLHVCLMLALGGHLCAASQGDPPIRSTAKGHVVRPEWPHI